LGKEYNEYYAKWKDGAKVQTGGFGIGFERLLKFCLGVENILDVRFPHDSGPNCNIESEV
jgi:asparaginyl-tRNA synthetase